MAEPIPNKDHDPNRDAKKMSDGIFRWVWPRKPISGKGSTKTTPGGQAMKAVGKALGNMRRGYSGPRRSARRKRD